MRTYAPLAVLFLLACQPPTPQEVAAQTASDVDALLTGALDTARSTNTWSSIDSAYSIAQPAGTITTRPTVPQNASTGDTMRFLRYYSQRIFTEANVEPGSRGTIFIIRGSDICTSPDRPTATDSDCIRRVDEAQLKVRVGGNIDLALQVGPERIEPFQLQLRGGKAIAYVVDLALSQKAYLFLSKAFGAAMPEWAFEARGRYEMRLDRNAVSDYSLSLSVLDDISFAVTDKNGVRRAFTTERRAPMWSVRLDGSRRVAIFGIDIGRTQWDGVGSDLFDQRLTGPLHAELAGYTLQTTFSDGATEQRATGVSLGQGTSFIQYAGQTVLTLDVNDQTGRRFDIAMRNTPQNTTQFEVTPSFDLSASFAFSALAPATSHDAFQNARYTASWKGSDRSVMAEWSRASGTFPQQLKLVSGGLQLTSSRPGDLPRQFLQGMCLGSKQSAPGSMPHPILDLFEATACRP